MKHVPFEIAKLLKEKGFDIDKKYQNYYIEKYYYNEDGDLIECEEQSGSLSLYKGKYSAPAISDIVDWLLENHRIDIIVKYPESKTNKVEGINTVYYDLEIYKLDSGDAWKVYKFNQYSDKKQDVYLYGIEYTLNNLI